MPLYKDEVEIVKEEEGTEGGKTYHVIFKNDPERKVKKICFRLSKSPDHPGERCSKSAGANTAHSGFGACSLHGGNNFTTEANVMMKNGKSAYMTQSRLAGRINSYLNEDAEMQYDLTQELAAMRAIFQEFLDNMNDPEDNRTGYNNDIIRASMLVGTISNTVEKISKINSRNTLTAAQAIYIRALIVDILVKYLKDPDERDRAVKELMSRFGGGENIPHTIVGVDKYEKLGD